MSRRNAFLLLLLGVAVLAGCDGPPAGSLPPVDLSKRKARVLATTSMIADLVRQLGGSHVEVTQMMQAGVDPHSYRASAGDVQKMQQADIVFHNGLHLEGKMSDVFEQMAQRVRTVAVTRDLSPATDLRKAEEGYEGTHDPHVWFSVRLWSKVAETVCNALCDLDPAHAAEFRQNTSAYQKQLTALDEEVRVKAQLVPESRRKLVTAHDAFYYFGQAYGFEVRGLQGVSTNDEPNTRRVQELARYIAENKIPAIFGESSVPDRSIEAVQQASKKGWKHDVRLLGGELFSDSLDDADKPAGTYIGMIRHNVDTIVNALK